MPTNALAERSVLENISTPHIVLLETETNTVLFEKNAREKAYPASTTKIMTCIVALEHCQNLDTFYTCGYEAVNGFGPNSSLLGLKQGYKVTIKDLLYGLMLCSGNDCGACLAVATAGSMEAFIGLMNAKAEELGMTGTHYTNAHGLQNEDHYTTAYDMALLMKYAIYNPTFREIISATQYTVQEANNKFRKTIYTSNKLLYTKETDTEDNKYPYCIGGKTGETNWAGYCLVEAAKKDGVTLVAVLLGDNNMGGVSQYYRFRNAKLLFDYGFRQFVSYDLSHFNVPTEFNVQATGYDMNDPNRGMMTAEVDISGQKISGTRDDMNAITDDSFTWGDPVLDPYAINAPVNVGDKIGTVTLFLNGEPLFTGDLIATSAVSDKPVPIVTPAPTTQVDGETPSARRDVCNITVSKNGGEPEYTIWYFWNGNLYTKDDKKNKTFLLFLDGEVFRTAKVPAVSCDITLYKRVEDDFGFPEYVIAGAPEDGESYVIVSQFKALRSSKKGRTLAAVEIEVDENGVITSDVKDDMVWTFKANGGGFNILSKNKYLHRYEGNGLLFWILIGILVTGLAIVIRLIVTSRTRRRNPRMRGRYRIYRM
ncbi:MAG: D-alanyl-D-alanine carboxypeptidase [Clostridia bacterium]|nr:D-alanyl-D-alanine carboxypeptidase [Clostridia bacterium]